MPEEPSRSSNSRGVIGAGALDILFHEKRGAHARVATDDGVPGILAGEQFIAGARSASSPSSVSGSRDVRRLWPSQAQAPASAAARPAAVSQTTAGGGSPSGVRAMGMGGGEGWYVFGGIPVLRGWERGTRAGGVPPQPKADNKRALSRISGDGPPVGPGGAHVPQSAHSTAPAARGGGERRDGHTKKPPRRCPRSARPPRPRCRRER